MHHPGPSGAPCGHARRQSSNSRLHAQHGTLHDASPWLACSWTHAVHFLSRPGCVFVLRPAIFLRDRKQLWSVSPLQCRASAPAAPPLLRLCAQPAPPALTRCLHPDQLPPPAAPAGLRHAGRCLCPLCWLALRQGRRGTRPPLQPRQRALLIQHIGSAGEVLRAARRHAGPCNRPSCG